MSILKRRKNITLQQRLAQLTGHLAEINGEGLGLEPGKLQRVFKRNFIQVSGELFVPLSLQSIRVSTLNLLPGPSGSALGRPSKRGKLSPASAWCKSGPILSKYRPKGSFLPGFCSR
ncbi:hypothetical protein CM49_04951 [Paenibacillus sp. P1XP2]|nr:hypothetical protein CM49_04951 [Paenibacillus sp. P1XP2]